MHIKKLEINGPSAPLFVDLDVSFQGRIVWNVVIENKLVWAKHIIELKGEKH